MMITVSEAQEQGSEASSQEQDLVRETRDALLGKQMPRLSLGEWDNEELDLRDLRGHFVVVNFWATWCPDCIATIEDNNEFFDRYENWSVKFIGVCSSDRGQEKMRETVTEYNIEYPVATDPSLNSMKDWHTKWWPTYALVDPEGVVRAVESDIRLIERAMNRIGRFEE